MFVATLFTVAKLWKQPVSINGYMDKGIMVCIYAMKCYSTVRKNEILLFKTSCMDLETLG